MKFGLKVHHTDLEYMLDMRPDALEFVIFEDDLGGEWSDSVGFSGPKVVHMPEKYADSSLIDLGASDGRSRQNAVDILKRTIDLAGKLNAFRVVCHPGGVRKRHEGMDVSFLFDSMRELQAYAGNVELVMENMPDIYWYRGELWTSNLFKDAGEIKRVLDTLGMGMCMDLCHAKLYCNAKHIDFLTYVEALKPYIRHIHISDALGFSNEGLQIGEGEIDFKGLLHVLDGIDVIAVPEIVNGHKASGLEFKIARGRLAHLGFFDRPAMESL